MKFEFLENKWKLNFGSQAKYYILAFRYLFLLIVSKFYSIIFLIKNFNLKKYLKLQIKHIFSNY